MATLAGTAGADQITGTLFADIINGLAGNDTILGRSGNDSLDGGSGDDRLDGGAGRDSVSGGDGADTLVGSRGNDVLSGGAGNDVFLFASRDGQDVIRDLSAGDKVVISGYAAAQSVTQVGTSVVVTLSLSDKITFSNSNVAAVQAALQFGDGGGVGTPGTISGTSGNDTLNGTAGNDLIQGLAGNDAINGGAGNDRIIGGLGDDTLTGGAGSDTFVYLSLAELSATYGAEFITDWSADDRIDLSGIDANELIAGNQAFAFAGYSFGHPPAVTTPGTLTIGGFGGELWILGYTDGDAAADMMISLWSVLGEGALTVDNLIL